MIRSYHMNVTRVLECRCMMESLKRPKTRFMINCHLSTPKDSKKGDSDDMKTYLLKQTGTFFELTKQTLSNVVSTSNEASKVVLSNIKGSLLETLAKRLPQKEKDFLAERWGYNQIKSTVEKQTNHILEDTSKSTIIEPSLSTSDTTVTSLDHQRNISNVLTVVETDDHSYFGRLVADLGYKKVYLANVKMIAVAPVWEKNRILRPERAKSIAQSKVKLAKSQNKNHPSLSGVITFYHDVSTDQYGIVDGQHRAASLVILCQEGHWDESAKNVLIDVFETNSVQQVNELFKEINSSEPVRMIDMPDAEGATDDIRKIVTEAADELQSKYPEMFKPSARCRPPHLNADNLRDDLFLNNYLHRHVLKDVQSLIQRLESVNNTLSKYSDDQWMGNKPIDSLGTTLNASESALKKARANNFYLGLDKSWLKK